MNTSADQPAPSGASADCAECNLLIVEDNKGDAVLISKALSMAGVPCHVTIARDGDFAVQYLSGKAADKGAPTHLLVDLKMPKRSGLELLEWVRGDGRFRALRAIVLTSSNLEADKVQARQFGIDAYLIKPGSLPEYVDIAIQISEIWGLTRHTPTNP
jgi:CheY-like chemotaxis protein